MSDIKMSELTSFLLAQSKKPSILFTHHATAEGYTELHKLIKETYEKYGKDSPM